MMRPKLSTFPLHRPFFLEQPDAEIAEVALRLVVDIFKDSARVVGTATPLCGNLLVTARHVIETAFHGAPATEIANRQVNRSLSAAHVLRRGELEYVIWDVLEVSMDPLSDIALLRVGTNPHRSNPGGNFQWRQPTVNPFSPDIGERVAALGYANCSIRVSKNDQGGPHVELNGDLMSSVGVVREIFEIRRDQLLPFPCFQVSARFDGGMSGGAVFDETGALCGLVCSNIHGSHLDGEPVSYVTALWPIFRGIINWDRGDNYPRGVRYPAIELVRGGQIVVSDRERLEKWFADRIGPHPLPDEA